MTFGCGTAELAVDEQGEAFDYPSAGEFESEPPYDPDAPLEQALVSCAPSHRTGYENGASYPITVVTADGKPAEVATANAYALMQADAAKAGVHLRVRSGFRSQEEQQYLYACYTSCSCNGCNLAAKPGYSNHQSGEALDLNTRAPGVYKWLAKNAGRFGFVRTVASEPWHWEFRGAAPAGGPCSASAEISAQPAIIGLVPSPTGSGYWLAKSDGGVFSFKVPFHGSAGGKPLNARMVGFAGTPDGGGYWLVSADGGIFAFGNAGFHGSLGGKALNAPVVGMAPTANGGGYWLVSSDGGVFAFGNAGFHGSMGGRPLNKPIVGMAATPDGNGYWLVASDGGLFAFGNAGFHGSTGAMALTKPIAGMARTATGNGYWLVAEDGGVFAFGDAGFYGSLGGVPLSRPITSIRATPSGKGYWLVGADGGVFSFGDAQFHGGLGG